MLRYNRTLLASAIAAVLAQYRAATALLLCLLLAACGKSYVKPDPVDENVDPVCRVACDVAIPLWTPPDPSNPAAWDTYPEQVVIPLQSKIRACDVQRQACVQGLDRLKKAGVTR